MPIYISKCKDKKKFLFSKKIFDLLCFMMTICFDTNYATTLHHSTKRLFINKLLLPRILDPTICKHTSKAQVLINLRPMNTRIRQEEYGRLQY